MFNRLKLKEKWLVLSVLTVTVFMFLAFVWLYVSQNTGILTDENYTFYYYGSNKTIEKGSRLDTTEDAIGLINSEITNRVPLINKNRILLTGNMVYYRLSSYRLEMVPIFTKIEKAENKDFMFVDDYDHHTSIKAEQGFLYDGNSIYIFLQKVNLSYNGKEVTLSPMSFLCYTKDCVSYYDAEKQKGYMEQLYIDEVVAECDAYKILVDSSVVYQGDINTLLFTETSALNSVFK